MTQTVTLLTDRPAFPLHWAEALERERLRWVARATAELALVAAQAAAVVVDAGSPCFDDDELVAALGFIRAAGGFPVVHLPRDSARTEADDLVHHLCGGLVAHSGRSIGRIARTLARHLDHGAARRFEYVAVSPRADELLVVASSGDATLVPRPLGPDDDGSAIVEITLAADATGATLTLAGGGVVLLEGDVLRARRSSVPPASAAIALDGARLGAHLKALRLRAGLTQAEVSRRTGIRRPNIARVEAGRHLPSLPTLARLAEAIGVSPTDILESADDDAPA
ncbi:MAG: helix-turn-helix transcriptional regulator [Myxococcales bacterium]|nr:helix-turn-helix transcriptional regulator [Myxococcales bacterium]